ncbi:hypothetical protein L6164_004131 [Bauhinia variegata]|uniref:Uncharacterized protein n=1 Tax=Bauhinia variegata TaxID=167791 RepID=A0ACB9Q460_BAUVA|nr:hypothetical protein L6164_004131 [Bauhinia variegata]
MIIITFFFFFTAIFATYLLQKHIKWRHYNYGGQAAAGFEEDGEMTEKYGGDFCAVCLSQICDGEEIKTLAVCKHSFHVDCVDAWLKNHSTCPLCRNNNDLNQGHNNLGDASSDLLQKFSSLVSIFCCIAFQPKIMWDFNTFHHYVL